MFIIGIDPHKGSHTAAVLDEHERRWSASSGSRRTVDNATGCSTFAAPFEPRTWAIEAAGGLGALLAQQLVAAGETVLDVPPALSARARLLDSGRTDKSDPHDARSAAIVALRHDSLQQVRPVDHTAVLRLLADRRHDLRRGCGPRPSAGSTPCCACSAPVGCSQRLSADRAAKALADDPARRARRRRTQAHGPRAPRRVRRLDQQLAAISDRITDAVAASGTTVTDVYGIGPVLAAIIVGHTGSHRPVPDRRALRPLQRHRPDRSLRRAEGPTPPQPPREPATQPRPAHRGRHPDRATTPPAASTSTANSPRARPARKPSAR